MRMASWHPHEPRPQPCAGAAAAGGIKSKCDMYHHPSASASSTTGVAIDKTKITLAGAEATLLSGVWCRAQDAASPDPILGDPYAQVILDHCDVDCTRGSLAHLHDERWARLGAGRAKALDDWCQAFLDDAGDEPVQVLQIACGLDSRALRIRRGPNVRWIDLDRPLVVNLRERIYGAARWDPQRGGGEYLLRNLSFTSDRWLRDIPQDRRTLVITEGLLYHLSEAQVQKMIRDVVDHFGGPRTTEKTATQEAETDDDTTLVDDDDDDDYDDDEKKEGCRPRQRSSRGDVRECEIVFDVLGTLIRKRTSHVEWLRPTGIKVMSGFDSAEDILPFHPRLRLLETMSWDEIMRTERKAACAPPWFGAKTTKLASILPSFWDFCQVMRFQF